MPTGIYDRSKPAHLRVDKHCPKCGLILPIDEFPRNRCRSDGRQTYCKKCGILLRRSTQRISDLKRKYGITPETYDSFIGKDRPCAVCGEMATHLDHNHLTGKVRGGLCQPCNIGLGHFKDSPHLLEAAANYIKRRD